MAEQEILSSHGDPELPADAQARWDELTAEADGLEKRLQRQAQLDELDRRIAGTPAGGGVPGRPEVRVFPGAPAAAPEAFDSAILRTQTGERVPVLEARHRLADSCHRLRAAPWRPSSASAASCAACTLGRRSGGGFGGCDVHARLLDRGHWWNGGGR